MKNYIFIFLLMASLALQGQEVRTIDGSGNNQESTTLGAAHTQLKRVTSVDYLDLISIPGGEDRLNPREISNILFDQESAIEDRLSLSDYIWVFGQFVDHDISLTENFDSDADPQEFLPIVVPFNDEYFAPGSMIPMMRSLASENTGTSIDNPRQHDNAITAFIDASAVYGSDEERAIWLRTLEHGKLKTSAGNNLPWNTISGEFNSPVNPNVPFMENGGFSSKFYVAGDVRANENPLLISMHTLFVREHNLLCDEILLENPNLSDEQVYQHARRILSGKFQSIVYNEWLPTLNVQIPEYVGYSKFVDPSISNVFSAAAFRMGHTLINSNLIRMKNNGELIATGNITLKDAFFNPLAIDLAGGIDTYIKGMGTQIQQDFDCKVVPDVRNFLFGDPSEGGLDLAAININRGRERGLPDYNTVRENFGLPRINQFSELCTDEEITSLLEEVFETVDNIDPWVGMLAEIHLNESLFGELVMKILESQFRALRDGDRFYFENDDALSLEEKEVIRSTTLQSIIMRNTNIDLMQDNVFRAMPHGNIPDGPILEKTNLFAVLYPNPVIDHFYLKVYSETNAEAKVEVFDNLGLPLKNINTELIEGDNTVVVDVDPNLESGVYNVKITSNNSFTLTRFYKI